MKMFFLIGFLIACLMGSAMGQEAVIKGTVIDKKTRQPVVAANLVLPDGTGAYSMDEGRFSLKIPDFPVVIKVSHISYGSTEIVLNYAPKSELVIELDELVGEIGEVQITAKRLRILTEREDFSIQDFAFDNENLWLLGYTNNQGSKGKLWLANWFGDTITSVPVKGAESLYRDVFGSVHLVLRDSVYQLYAEGRNILLPWSVERTDFFRIMDPICARFAEKLVYSDIDLYEQLARVYYRSEDMPGPQLLTIVEDQPGRLDRKLEQKVGSMWTSFYGKYPVKSGTKVSAIMENPIKVPVFSWKDTLFVINLYKDSLLSYGPNGKFKRAVPFNYCRDVILGGIDGGVRYKNIAAQADPVGRGLYLLEHKKTTWTLFPLHTQTGKVSQPVNLPEYPDMYGITVFGNAVYFLYPEKKYPYYVRLYRYQL